MVRIWLTFREMVLLHDAMLNKQVIGTGPYYMLLQEHAADFMALFEKYIDRGVARARIKFTSLQAMAFMHLWIDQPLPANAGAYVIQDVIAQIHREHIHKQITLAEQVGEQFKNVFQ